jgi:hypothetical protein
MSAAITAAPPRALVPATRRWLPVALAGLAACTLGFLGAADPETWYRPLFALLLAANLAAAAVWSPRAAILLAFAALPFVMLLRRLLIADAGWVSRDPLVLVGAAVALVFVARLFIVERRRVPMDALSVLISSVLVLAVAGAFNPDGGGLLVGLAGILFMGAPLLWYFVGHALLDHRLARRLIHLTIALSVVAALYGLAQSELGLPSWDRSWVELDGYYALFVGGVIRPFGTFPSASEYLLYVGAGFVFSAVLLREGRRLFAVALLPLGLALLIGSGRSALVLTGLATVAVSVLATRGAGRAIVVGVVGLAVLAGVVTVLVPALATEGGVVRHPALLTHQSEGLTSPLDDESSTLRLHWDLFAGGIAEGFRHPLGYGTGVSNTAIDLKGEAHRPDGVRAKVFEDRSSLQTDIDVSNVFVSLGFAGGCLFGAIVLIALTRSVALYRRRRDPLVLATIGLLIASGGQWLTGGHYTLSPLTWLFIGWVSREWASRAAGPSERQP